MTVLSNHIDFIKETITEKYPLHKQLGLDIEIDLSHTIKIDDATYKIKHLFFVLEPSGKAYLKIPVRHVSLDLFFKRISLANPKLNKFIKNLVQSNCV